MQITVKAVFFDHDDTLVATREAKFAHHKHVAKTHYGKTLTDEELLLHWGKPLPELVSKLYGTNDVEDALAKCYATRDDFPKILFKETLSTIQYLHTQNKLLGVITATTLNSFENDLHSLGIPRELLDYIQTAEDTPYHKPNPKVFAPTIQWLSKKQINPSEVLYVADGLHDMEAALGAGFYFVGVETGLITNTQFSENGVQSLPNIGSLREVIKQELRSYKLAC